MAIKKSISALKNIEKGLCKLCFLHFLSVRGTLNKITHPHNIKK